MYVWYVLLNSTYLLTYLLTYLGSFTLASKWGPKMAFFGENGGRNLTPRWHFFARNRVVWRMFCQNRCARLGCSLSQVPKNSRVTLCRGAQNHACADSATRGRRIDRRCLNLHRKLFSACAVAAYAFSMVINGNRFCTCAVQMFVKMAVNATICSDVEVQYGKSTSTRTTAIRHFGHL